MGRRSVPVALPPPDTSRAQLRSLAWRARRRHHRRCRRPVTIVDRVTLPRAEAPGWVERLHRDYQPSAEARGLHLAGVWETRADGAASRRDRGGLDRCPGVRAFFGHRADGSDPAVDRVVAGDRRDRAAPRTRRVLDTQLERRDDRRARRSSPSATGDRCGRAARAARRARRRGAAASGESTPGCTCPGSSAPLGLRCGRDHVGPAIATADAADLDDVLAIPRWLALARRAPDVATAVTLDTDRRGARRDAEPPLVKRTLLLRVLPTIAVRRSASVRGSTSPRCPSTSHTIRSWRARRGTAVDSGRWTHAGSRSSRRSTASRGEYMLHPFHWTTVDAWFDPEVPDHIVEPELAHLFTERHSGPPSLMRPRRSS